MFPRGTLCTGLNGVGGGGGGLRLKGLLFQAGGICKGYSFHKLSNRYFSDEEERRPSSSLKLMICRGIW